jgi:ligand-binding SRPBCC domain-containing protein
MNASTFQAELWLPKAPEQVFAFFSEARNLQAITPGWLNFVVLTPEPIELCRGALIDYRLRVHGIPFRWQSEITAWEPPHRFVDEQRRGPYKLWIHEHRFEAREGGTLASDFMLCSAPGGKLMEWLFVRRDVERIFEFRKEKLSELFGRCAAQTGQGAKSKVASRRNNR